MRPRWKAEIKRYLMVLSGVRGACLAEEEKACISVALFGQISLPSFFAPPERTMVASTLVCLEYQLNCVDQWPKLKPKTSSID